MSDRFTNIGWHTPTQSTFLLSDQNTKNSNSEIRYNDLFFKAVITDSKIHYNGF